MADILSTATEIVPLHELNVVLKTSETELSALKEKFKDVPLEPKNALELAKVDAAWREHYYPRLDIEKKVKGTVSEVYAQYKQIKGRGEEIVAAWKAEEDKFKAILSAEEERKKAERKAKVEAELARVTAIRAQIDGIKAIPLSLGLASSKELAFNIFEIDQVSILESGFQEFFQEAVLVKANTISTLELMLEAKQKAEELAENNRIEAERLAKERAEFELQQQLERERQAVAAKEAQQVVDAENARIRAEQQAEADRLAAQQAEIKRQSDELAEKQAKAERVERKKKEAELAKAEAKELAKKLAAEEKERQEKEQADAETKMREAEEYQAWLSEMNVVEAFREISERSTDRAILDICAKQISGLI